MKKKYFSDWLVLGGILLGIGIAIFSFYQPLVALVLGLLASLCSFIVWILLRRERKRDTLAAEQRLREVDQNADLRIQQVQYDTEQRSQEIEGRIEENENNVSAMDERWNYEL